MEKFGASQGITSTISGNEFDCGLNLIKTDKDKIGINDDMQQKIKSTKES